MRELLQYHIYYLIFRGIQNILPLVGVKLAINKMIDLFFIHYFSFIQ